MACNPYSTLCDDNTTILCDNIYRHVRLSLYINTHGHTCGIVGVGRVIGQCEGEVWRQR